MSHPTPPNLKTLEFLGLNFDNLNENAQNMTLALLKKIMKANENDYLLINELADQITELSNKEKNKKDAVNSLLDFYSGNIISIRKWYNNG